MLSRAAFAFLWKRNGGMVVGEGAPARWQLVGLDTNEAAN
jgi:hypothetical protein